MKKIFLILLVCCTAAAAFAQFTFSVSTTAATNVYGIIIPTGLHAEPYRLDFNGNRVPNNGAQNAIYDGLGLVPRKTSLLFLPLNNPDLLLGSYIPISQAVFRPSIVPGGGFNWTEGSGFSVNMGYNANNIEGNISFGGGDLMTYFMYSTHPETKGSFTLNSLLDSFKMGEYWIRANTNLFTVVFGNRQGEGRTDIINDHNINDWILTPTRIDGFGVNVPSSEGPLSPNEGHRNLNNIGANSFLFALRGGGWGGFDVASYLVGTIKLLEVFPTLPFPMFVDLGMDFDPGLFTDQGTYDKDVFGNRNPSYNATDGFTNAKDFFGQFRIGGGIRFSAVDIADGNLTFDIAYKLRGGDPTTANTYDDELGLGSEQPDGTGSFSHVIGAYFTMPKLVPDLNVSVGLTGLFRSFEDETAYNADGDRYVIKTTSPFFFGVDLFFRYSGIQDIRLTFKTNVSFSSVPEPLYDGDDNITTRRYTFGYALPGSGDLLYLNDTLPFYSQSWFALYNSLAVRLLVTGRLNLFFEIISQLGILTDYNSDPDRTGFVGYGYLDSWGTRERAKHTMSAAIYAVHEFSANINLQVGFAMLSEQSFTTVSNFGVEPTEYAPTSFHTGAIGISIPLKMKIKF